MRMCAHSDYLDGGGESTAFNLGTGRGHSVREVIAAGSSKLRGESCLGARLRGARATRPA
jgi:UDP-glucose 4-epimerase